MHSSHIDSHICDHYNGLYYITFSHNNRHLVAHCATHAKIIAKRGLQRALNYDIMVPIQDKEI